MSGGKRSYEYGIDKQGEPLDPLTATLAQLTEAIEGYKSPYWDGRDDHKETLARFEAARRDVLAKIEVQDGNPATEPWSKAEGAPTVADLKTARSGCVEDTKAAAEAFKANRAAHSEKPSRPRDDDLTR
ncbi:MAG TPA: hypothetical protein VI168_03295 [Croceibacterium sp.]